ncbi:Der GTPase-activating protein YihI [Aliivibrio fischeri]|uniref:Der GTPase-activating protein YihI n=1 Tax=Aliivibrio fischeri TaxID=668 RepID=A0A6N3YZM2_ALIFS|nr:Der GTPase-activating protein YihI [Aliivibrio fischeri]MCE7556509.1 Der GTPase-activating protein YihI [Aliivibrio fischeri]MCE7563227.1 Der GTPase-activating protein YihI [Aliivibrio fischeri]MCE7570352.1 Der GTPase-activating protein YihI [Aliivibrio fischeri]MUK37875.1 Der GTPase-activating protein YihI [Aliivibrio fischeri]MUK40079.1 Der GTPase-activating protein YihI [Aliivibrio fischeri]
MSRIKKARKPGMSSQPVVVTRNRTDRDVESREIKRKRKRKGLKAGARNAESNAEQARRNAQKKDPRLGSKKPIQLVVEAKQKTTKQERRLTNEQELAMLENDAQLMVLLDRLDSGENLGTGLQKYVDEKLARIEHLMGRLGLLDDEEPEEIEEFPEFAERKAKSDDDLLAEFDDFNMDDFK